MLTPQPLSTVANFFGDDDMSAVLQQKQNSILPMRVARSAAHVKLRYESSKPPGNRTRNTTTAVTKVSKQLRAEIMSAVLRQKRWRWTSCALLARQHTWNCGINTSSQQRLDLDTTATPDSIETIGRQRYVRVLTPKRHGLLAMIVAQALQDQNHTAHGLRSATSISFTVSWNSKKTLAGLQVSSAPKVSFATSDGRTRRFAPTKKDIEGSRCGVTTKWQLSRWCVVAKSRHQRPAWGDLFVFTMFILRLRRTHTLSWNYTPTKTWRLESLDIEKYPELLHVRSASKTAFATSHGRVLPFAPKKKKTTTRTTDEKWRKAAAVAAMCRCKNIY